MIISESIFRQYDIRGVYPSTINESIAEIIGKSLGTYLKKNKLSTVVVGRDNRKSSPLLSKPFINGLLYSGIDVVDVGISLTPAIHFFTCTHNFDAGVMITASHNPKEYNGFRVDLKNAESLYGTELNKIYNIATEKNFFQAQVPGRYVFQDLLPSYVKYLTDRFKINNKFKVVLDCGNGCASLVAQQVFSTIGAEVIPLYCDINSDFPHGIPDPENRMFLATLREKVLESNADIGLAFDTDVDRFGVVDKQGNIYETDKVLHFFAKHILPSNQGATVIYDVKSSGILDELITRYGGIPKMIRTGHPFFTREIQKGALFGCEFSGHAYFGKDYFGYDDGIYAACNVLEILDKNYPLTFAESVSDFPVRAHTNELKLSCADSQKFGIIQTLESNLKPNRDILSVVSVDGVRVHMSNTGWFLIRASNTSPLLSVRAEGFDEAEVRRLLGTVHDLLTSFDDIDLSPLISAEIYLS